MAKEGPLDGLFVGADHVVEYRSDQNPPEDMTGWTIVLDIRRKDTHGTALLTKAMPVTGTYNSTPYDPNNPASNPQKASCSISDDELSATIFKGDDEKLALRYSIKRTNDGFEQPLRYGDCQIIRVTQV